MCLTPNARRSEVERAPDGGFEWINWLMTTGLAQRIECRETEADHELRADDGNLRQSELTSRADKIAAGNTRPHVPHLDGNRLVP